MNFLAASLPGGIERQEKQGQLEQAKLQTLPKDLRKERPLFEKLGFIFGEDADDIFVNVQFPAGWTKKPTDHAMWSKILDEKGWERGSIFYKAAFYDRHAHALLERRFGMEIVDYSADPQQLRLTDACGELSQTSKPFGKLDWPAEDSARVELTAWLTANYPEWESPLAYWVMTSPSELQEAIAEWKRIKDWMEIAKPREMELRRMIANHFFADPREGTQTAQVDVGEIIFQAKLVSDYNYKVDDAKAREVCAELPAGLVKWKPELSVSEYRKLTDEQKLLAGQCLTITPGAPKLEITEVVK